jgi:hypothetical protein
MAAVTCESNDGIFEACRRSKARNAETSDEKSLRYALQRLSTSFGQAVVICSRR